jgi:preprotein translocase subunit SecD
MKTILYIFIIVMTGSIVLTALPGPQGRNDTIINLKCTEQNVDSSALQKALYTMEQRLVQCGIEHFKTKADAGSSTISIKISDSVNRTIVVDLLTIPGKIEFYETGIKETFLSQNKENDCLRVFMKLSVNKDLTGAGYEDVLGYFHEADKRNLAYCIEGKSSNTPGKEEVKLVWGYKRNNLDLYPLYLLKSTPFLDGISITESKAQTDENGMSYLLILFNRKSSDVWSRITRQNINKPVAMVLDERVYFAPVVRNEISGGKCQISGNFSHDEILMLAAIIESGELPAKFIQLK